MHMLIEILLKNFYKYINRYLTKQANLSFVSYKKIISSYIKNKFPLFETFKKHIYQSFKIQMICL